MNRHQLIAAGLAFAILLALFLGLAALLARAPAGGAAGGPSETALTQPSLVERLATIDTAYLTRPPTIGPSPTPMAATEQVAAEATPNQASANAPQTTHIVQAGENLYRISLAYGVSLEAIMGANSLVDPGLLQVGQVLIIPVTPPIENQLATVDPRSVTEPPTLVPTGTPGPPTSTPIPPTDTPPPPTETPTPTPTRLTTINGIALDSFLIMPENVKANARAIFAAGQRLGRNPGAYSKVGDSTIENPHFMVRFDEGPYNLGEYAYLQGAIDHFAGSHARQGLAVRRGFHSWTVTDPMWADKSVCQANESPVACEIRVHNPSVMLFRLGSNDRGVPAGFEQNLRQAVQIAIDSGVIPVLGTKADRFEGSNINNDIIRQLAADFQLPLWDFDLLAGTIPGRGLDVDAVHLTTFYAHDYTSPTAYQRGHGVHNLSALMVLDAIWREIIQNSGE